MGGAGCCWVVGGLFYCCRKGYRQLGGTPRSHFSRSRTARRDPPPLQAPSSSTPSPSPSPRIHPAHSPNDEGPAPAHQTTHLASAQNISILRSIPSPRGASVPIAVSVFAVMIFPLHFLLHLTPLVAAAGLLRPRPGTRSDRDLIEWWVSRVGKRRGQCRNLLRARAMRSRRKGN